MVGSGLEVASAWFSETRMAAEESTVAASAGVAPTTDNVLDATVEGTVGVELAWVDVRTSPPTISAAMTTTATPVPITQGVFDPLRAA